MPSGGEQGLFIAEYPPFVTFTQFSWAADCGLCLLRVDAGSRSDHAKHSCHEGDNAADMLERATRPL